MEILPGIIHGKTIELSSVPGMADGERVIVTIEQAISSNSFDTPNILPGPPPKWQPGKSVGGCLANVWSAEDDRILAEIERERQAATFREVDE